jgi:hypothetical protein
MEPLVAEKRRLFNELLRAKGNIRVFCRSANCSPPLVLSTITQGYNCSADDCSADFVTYSKEYALSCALN